MIFFFNIYGRCFQRQIAEVARLSADHLIKAAVVGPLLSEGHRELLAALQLDEAAEVEKVRGRLTTAAGVHVSMHEV